GSRGLGRARRDHAFHRVDDAEISRAPAQIAGKLDPDAVRVRVRKPPYNVTRRNQHARRAEAALQAMLTRKCRAELLHDRVGVEAFDRLHRKAVALNRIGDAGARRFIIDQHGTCAAYAVLAPEMGPRQAAMLAQEIGKMGARLDQRLDLPPVHAERDWRHGANTCIKARVTTAVAMPCSTASSPLTDCASAWPTASVEAAVFPCLATCCAKDASGCGIPRGAPRKMLATPDSGSKTAAALASANSPILRQDL